jgi:GH15 family glucan-1,4-alpha-glucosidase
MAQATTKIEDYGFLSDTQTGALVSRDGCVDWLCFPRFDSPACFASLLGEKKNGHWRFFPEEVGDTWSHRDTGSICVNSFQKKQRYDEEKIR